MSEVTAQQIAIEQQIVDKVYARLEVMRAQTRELTVEGHRRAASGPLTGLVERDAMVLGAAAKMSDLDSQEEGIVFGRLDFDDGDTYRIGRLGVRDEDREPLVVDWRAPAAAPFYRATPGEPLGVDRRRVITCEGPKVVALDDEVLSQKDVDGVVGEGALLRSLTRERGEHMRDIVTTIQREQDEAIRAPAHGVTLITGGPGTGKTQVALHRAAYLLYTDRSKFADGRVLVVGPSTVFTEYIGRVLPGLGEDSVHLRAIGELFEGVTAIRRDPANVAKVKGDLEDGTSADRPGVGHSAARTGPPAHTPSRRPDQGPARSQETLRGQGHQAQRRACDRGESPLRNARRQGCPGRFLALTGGQR